jgi:hypothetical protein
MGRALEIKDCSGCPHLVTTPYPTGDWFEQVTDWQCGKMKNKHIGYHEWNDVPTIPKWCPLPEVK